MADNGPADTVLKSYFPKTYATLQKQSRAIVLTFFCLLLLLGISIYRDYGISYDEFMNYQNGYVSLAHVVKKVSPGLAAKYLGGIPPLEQYRDKDYGVFFDLPVTVMQNALRITNQRNVVQFRHLITFLVFFTSVVFFYRLCAQRYNWMLGLLGSLVLIVSPRIFGQSFYNSKDIVFMAVMFMSVYTMFRFLRLKTPGAAIWHALACAAAIDVRIMGIIVPLLTLFLIALDLLKAGNVKTELRRWMVPLIVYLLLAASFVVIFWPYLWSSPLRNFIQAFANMSHFRWKDSVLFMGQNIPATQLPWYYLPVWIVISTPVVYTLLFVVGCYYLIKQVISNKFALYKNDAERIDIVMLMLFFGPLLAIIVLKSVVYDAWRQVYFVYPAFVMIALAGFVNLYRAINLKAAKLVLTGVLTVSMAVTAAFMVRNHPFQDMYFSFLPAKSIQKNFEKDYWGLSYYQALQYVLKHDKSKIVSILLVNDIVSQPVRMNVHMFPEEMPRIALTKVQAEARWFITNYRKRTGPINISKEVYSISVDGVKIISVFKLR
ncbi:hypothetical protein DJ568_03440 [Mucilaginibacter hurinus]|uniref:Glycosyltransferase RgtA/B/C/D-like domain-containing protein n=1 Tax=Mucilaginibacter hurinus TaxID=2201324 RepID=A0A367GSZ0_9SPHI|nr:hypothetical protein [Mucilaginibacter hurinus]RCH55823.1 hypothetical protein DJ568_03440 [Mucilaginibacter hurinus]